MNFNLFALTCGAIISCVFAADLPPPCSSEIYCYGRLIDRVMTNHLFNDSKTYVDLKLKAPPNETLALFDAFLEANNNEPSKEQLRAWVELHFDQPGSEIEPVAPVDHKNASELKIFNRIKDENLKKFAGDLHEIWPTLTRRMKNEVKEHPELSSIIYVPNPFVIAGGRFLEFYYWDSFWIVKGLLVSEMFETARGILENFLSVIDRFGFIPNGGRVYYLARSHPPLLSGMIKSYVDATNDVSFAINSIDILVREFEYFMTKMTSVRGHRLARYIDNSSGPRPESYREDVEIGKEFAMEEERENFYSDMKAGAESGMDFSSRWFITEQGLNNGTLKNIKTRSIIAVELNALLFWNAKIIAEFYGHAGNAEKQAEFEKKAEEIMIAVNEVLWDEEAGCWLDYDLINQKRRPFFSPTNLSPLYTSCFNESRRAHIADRVLAYLNATEVDKYPGGVPNSLLNTGEQWDYPNVWAPMQYIVIFSLENLKDERTSALAFKWAERWIRSNYVAYRDYGAMYEKYTATEFGVPGGGGEYQVQTGFGWSNGAVLDLLEKYADQLNSASLGQQQSTLLLLTILLIAAVFHFI